jgi:hypothetical protein
MERLGFGHEGISLSGILKELEILPKNGGPGSGAIHDPRFLCSPLARDSASLQEAFRMESELSISTEDYMCGTALQRFVRRRRLQNEVGPRFETSRKPRRV